MIDHCSKKHARQTTNTSTTGDDLIGSAFVLEDTHISCTNNNKRIIKNETAVMKWNCSLQVHCSAQGCGNRRFASDGLR